MTSAGPASCPSRGVSLTLTTEIRGDCVAVVAQGELSHATADDLRGAVDRAAGTPTVATVAVDLSEVDFIDSSGVTALLAARLRCETAGVELRVRRSRAVDAMLTRTALGPLFPE
jgi:anti-sigma B factor antagonist